MELTRPSRLNPANSSLVLFLPFYRRHKQEICVSCLQLMFICSFGIGTNSEIVHVAVGRLAGTPFVLVSLRSYPECKTANCNSSHFPGVVPLYQKFRYYR
uniref:Uncharacterized protein n=1 Tax=Cacopsylla melanoneura TaxID=428564 RepID=A0A8D9DYN9_9HEMI